MDKTNIEKSPFDNMHHVGVVVKDMDRAIEYYHSLGMGPFEPVKLAPSAGELQGRTVVSTPIISFGTVGGIGVELLQPTEEPSLIKEFFESKGEGIHHIAFLVDDLDKEIEKLAKKGLEVIFSQKFGDGGCAFFDTGKVGGAFIELIRPTAEFSPDE